MCNDTTFSEAIRDEIHLGLDELARRGAQRMLAAALLVLDHGDSPADHLAG